MLSTIGMSSSKNRAMNLIFPVKLEHRHRHSNPGLGFSVLLHPSGNSSAILPLNLCPELVATLAIFHRNYISIVVESLIGHRDDMSDASP